MNTTWEIDVFNFKKEFIGTVPAINMAFSTVLNEEGYAVFDVISFTDNYLTGQAQASEFLVNDMFNHWNMVEVFYVENTEAGFIRKSVWEGYVKDRKDSLSFSRIECTDFYGYADSKKIRSKTNFDNEQVENVMENAFAQINNVVDTGWRHKTTLSKTVKYQMEFGSSLAEVLREVVKVGGELSWKYPNVSISEFVGRDLTTSTGVTLEYNYMNPDSSNIELPREIKRYGSEKVNSVYFKYRVSGTTFGTAVERNIGENEEEISIFRDYGDSDLATATDKATEYILNSGDVNIEINVVLKVGFFEFGDFQLGDLVPLRLKTENPYMNFDTNYRILEISVSKGDFFISKIVVGNLKLKESGLKHVQSELRKLQLET